MSNLTTQPRNLDAIVLGTGEFSFSPGATSMADARTKGYRDFGNIVTVGFKPEVEIVEHEGSYRGKKRVDRRFATKGLLGYGLKCDELTRENLKIALGGADATPFTQAETSLASGDTWDFTSNKAVPNRWYDLAISAVRIREIEELFIAKAAPVDCTANASTETFTASGHGMVNGTPVRFSGTAVPGGLTAGTVYFTRDVDTNTFKVAATAGGPVIALSDAGTSVKFEAGLIPDTDYVLDAKLGRVRFIAEQTVDRTPLISCSQVTSADASALVALTPMDTLIQSGYGRIVIFDDTHPNKVVYDHVDFSCQVSFDSGADLDGKKVAEIDFKVLVTDNVGTVYSAE
jgi:hypothetical protein